MEIKLVKAYIVTEEKRQALTRTIAKQFPIRYREGNERWRRMERGERGPEPICKVQGRVLDKDCSHPWLLLLPEEEAGYAWYPAFAKFLPAVEAGVLERGGVLDDLGVIPTAIL